MKYYMVCACYLLSFNGYSSPSSESNFQLYKKVTATAEFKSHILIYFPLPEPRNITLRVIDGDFKDCDIKGILSDNMNNMILYANSNSSPVKQKPREVSYDLNITSKNCYGDVSLVNGHGKLKFSAVPNSDKSPRYQTIKRKHKVIIRFKPKSLVSG